MAKPKTPQPKTPETNQIRDNFLTPNSAVDLIVPFIPKGIKTIWDACAGENGDGQITKRLRRHRYKTFGSDIRGYSPINFLTYGERQGCYVTPFFAADCFVMNLPYSIKELFWNEALKYRIPIAAIVPAEYSAWIIQAVKNGAERVVPSARINFIPPTILTRIYERELLGIIKKDSEMKDAFANTPEVLKTITLDDVPTQILQRLKPQGEKYRYTSLDDVPQHLIYKHSSPQMHTMFLCHGFNIGRTETIVDYPLEQRKYNIYGNTPIWTPAAC